MMLGKKETHILSFLFERRVEFFKKTQFAISTFGLYTLVFHVYLFEYIGVCFSQIPPWGERQGFPRVANISSPGIWKILNYGIIETQF